MQFRVSLGATLFSCIPCFRDVLQRLGISIAPLYKECSHPLIDTFFLGYPRHGWQIATNRTYLDHSAQIRTQIAMIIELTTSLVPGCPPGLAVKRTADTAQTVFLSYIKLLRRISNTGGMRNPTWTFYWFSQQSFFLHRLGGVSAVTPSVSADSTIKATASATRAAETPCHRLFIYSRVRLSPLARVTYLTSS